MKKYDKGDDLSDILICFFNGKASLIEAINRKILYEEFIDFEKMLKEQNTIYQKFGDLEDDVLPRPKSPQKDNLFRNEMLHSVS